MEGIGLARYSGSVSSTRSAVWCIETHSIVCSIGGEKFRTKRPNEMYTLWTWYASRLHVNGESVLRQGKAQRNGTCMVPSVCKLRIFHSGSSLGLHADAVTVGTNRYASHNRKLELQYCNVGLHIQACFPNEYFLADSRPRHPLHSLQSFLTVRSVSAMKLALGLPGLPLRRKCAPLYPFNKIYCTDYELKKELVLRPLYIFRHAVTDIVIFKRCATAICIFTPLCICSVALRVLTLQREIRCK